MKAGPGGGLLVDRWGDLGWFARSAGDLPAIGGNVGAINRGLLPGPFQSGDDQVVTDSLAQEATRCQEKTFVIGLSGYTSLQRYIAKGTTGPSVGCFWWINNFTIRIAIKYWHRMKMLFAHVFFCNSSRAHLLLYKISRSWIDRVGLGSGFSSHRLLDSGQGLREKTCEGCHKYYKLFLTICKKKLVMMNCMKQRRRAVIWKPPCLGQTWSIDISKGRPPKTLFLRKKGGGQIPKFS